MNNLWTAINANANGIMAVTTALAGIIAYFAWRISRRTTRYQTIMDLFSEYRSYEMGKAMQRLWDLRRSCQDRAKTKDQTLEQEMIEAYREEYENDCLSEESLHMQRRKVSMFFQNLACLALKDTKVMKAIDEIWVGSDMRTIPEIIEILEMRALPQCTKREAYARRRDYPGYMNNMLFLNEAIPGNRTKYLIVRFRRWSLKMLGLRK